MPDLTITRTLKSGTTPFDADAPPVLSDATESFGLRRDDTSEIVVAAGTALTRISTGVYSLVVSGLVAGVSYTYYVATTINGATTRAEKHYTTPAATGTPDSQLARWYVSVAADPIATASEAAAYLKIIDVVESDMELFIASATDYAETVMGASLGSQTLVATFYDGEPLILTRGPFLEIMSITGAASSSTTDYALQPCGTGLRVVLQRTVGYPISITYRAGYAAVPQMFRLAIMQHAGTLYRNRESAVQVDLIPVPHSLEAFYRAKSRSMGIG